MSNSDGLDQSRHLHGLYDEADFSRIVSEVESEVYDPKGQAERFLETGERYVDTGFASDGVNEDLNAINLAQRLFERSLELYQKAGYIKGQVGALNGLGIVARARGEGYTAAEYFNEALALFHAPSNPAIAGHLFGNIGLVHSDARHWQEAETNLMQAMRYFGQSESHEERATAFLQLSHNCAEQQNWKQALYFAERARDVYLDVSARKAAQVVDEWIGELQLRM